MTKGKTPDNERPGYQKPAARGNRTQADVVGKGRFKNLKSTWDGDPAKAQVKPSQKAPPPVKSGPCHQTHPILTIGGGKVLGASCGYPRLGYDVYVGFDQYSMKPVPSKPWLGGPVPIQISYPIQDMGVPKDAEDFVKLVKWMAGQLADGKRIHMGCIGGHGRTGMVLAALVKVATGEEDAIVWVRKNHCKKGVESAKQVDFLAEHFGIKKAKGSKDYISAGPMVPSTTASGSTGTSASSAWKKSNQPVTPSVSQADKDAARALVYGNSTPPSNGTAVSTGTAIKPADPIWGSLSLFPNN